LGGGQRGVDGGRAGEPPELLADRGADPGFRMATYADVRNG
jgi:hypothetical protein